MARKRYQIGSLTMETRKDGTVLWIGRFWADECLPDGTFHRARRKVVLGNKQEMTKPLAKRALMSHVQPQNDMLLAARAGQPINPKAMVSVETIAQKYQENALCYSRKGTQGIRRGHLDNYIVPRFGKCCVGDVNREMLQSFLKGLEGKLNASTVTGVKVTLSLLFKTAVDFGYIEENPADKLRAPKYEAPEKVVLELAQVQSIIGKLSGVHHTALYALAETGLRSGELAGLRVEDVDLSKRTLSVKQTWHQALGSGAPKTRSSKRTLCISEKLAELLQEMLGDRTTGQVFTCKGDGHIDLAWFLTTVREAMSELGINPEQFNLHSFRHFNASLMASLRVPFKVAKNRLGHSTAGDITLGVYTHTFGDDERDAAEQIARAITGAETTTKTHDFGPQLTHENSAFMADLRKLMETHGVTSQQLGAIHPC